jgi:hypothetical protein
VSAKVARAELSQVPEIDNGCELSEEVNEKANESFDEDRRVTVPVTFHGGA